MVRTSKIDRSKVLLLVCFALISLSALGHGKKPHGTQEKAIEAPPVGIPEEINGAYLKSVKPIFQAKCFNCHSSETKYPWYHELPIVGRVMDSHIKEGRSHIDMTHDFPFKGHGGPIKDLEAIVKTTEEGTMPPWYYTPFNKNSKLTEDEKKTILNWSKQSLLKLKEKKKSP